LIDLISVRHAHGRHIVDWGAGARPCAVGRAGIGEKTTEGDGITPVGTWPLRRVLYRADRLAPPKTGLQLAAISANDGWCDAPDDHNYNLPVKLPYPASAERLWRDDALYDIVVVVGFNDTPIIPAKGSAIFLHVAAMDFAPTEGCVALDKADLLQLLAGITPMAKLRI
jgi:L,D-peptidoglycan transpeptidase YkuD (ErfK/YbiS/YcfS/YnhG family)